MTVGNQELRLTPQQEVIFRGMTCGNSQGEEDLKAALLLLLAASATASADCFLPRRIFCEYLRSLNAVNPAFSSLIYIPIGQVFKEVE